MNKLNLDKNKKYLLACSFGPDSMALFGMLLEGNYNFSVANVNYKMRGTESDNESQNLKEFCNKNGIKFYELVVEGKTLKGNFQKAAREVRYKFFAKIQQENKYDYVLVAHNLDDNITTYLMQKRRKTEVFYYGIQERAVINGAKILRPLLNVSKVDLEKYCVTNNIPYSIDSSNKRKIYARNKIMIDEVSKMNSEEKRLICEEINILNNKNRENYEKISNYVDNHKIFGVEWLREKFEVDENFVYQFIYYLFLKNNSENMYSKNIATDIISMIISDKPNRTRKLNDNLYLIKGYDYFFLSNSKTAQKFSKTVQKPCIFEYEHLKIDLNRAEEINLKDSDFPITIRSYKKNDEYLIKDYRKQINRLFIDMKLPTYFRNSWPIILTKDGVIKHIPRYRKDYVAKENDVIKIDLLKCIK